MASLTESPIRVVIAPAQSSYFAGESIAVTITFTNTHEPTGNAPSIIHTPTHKRGSHSISSAPLARPPTSPGMPSRSVVVPGLGSSSMQNHRHHGNGKEKEKEVPRRRKGLIGRPPVVVAVAEAAGLPELIEQRRRRLLAKSLSVSVSPSELERQLPEGTLVKTPTTTRALSIISEGSTSRLSASSRSPTPPSPIFEEARSMSASTSTSTAPSSPVVSPTNETTATTMTTTTTTTTAGPGPKAAHRPSSLELAPLYSFSYSQPSPARQAPSDSTASPYLQPRTASSPSFPISLASHPRTELILYAYAQLTGSLVLLPLPVDLAERSSEAYDKGDGDGDGDGDGGAPGPEAEGMKRLRARLMKRTVVGGGRMDITPSLQFQRSSSGTTTMTTTTTGTGTGMGLGLGTRTGPQHSRPAPPRPRPRHGHGRSTSLSAALFSSLLSSPTSPTSPLKEKSSGGPPWTSRDNQAEDEAVNSAGMEDIDPEEPLPMFDSQPSMLAVDLSLGPGESKSYTYSIELPSALPPTFRGRVIRFSYELSVGVCRSACGPLMKGVVLSPPPSLASGNGVSRVVKVPIRVYNYVAVGRVPRPYDLLWPVGRRIQEGKVQGEVVEGGKATSPVREKGTVEELREYAQRMFAAEERPKEEVEERIGCREAVEILTRNAKKVSYEVNRDGVHVAMLTFTKSAYRLGETVLGVVEFNNRVGRTRVLQMSAMLEAHEKVPSGLGSNGVVVRRVHAEQRQSFVMSVERTTFSLDIPSDASPGFEVGVGEEGGGGLEWRVRLCLVVAEGREMRGMEEDVGGGGRWGSGWVASGSIVPFERREVGERRGWSLWGGGRGEWERAAVSRVECSVPVGVCAAHTAFKAVSVVFEL